jgi:PAS domain S-box-containing protein
MFDTESARLVTSRDRRVMETNEAETEEEELTAVGITRTYLATKTPFRDPSGTVLGVLGISRDITDRKRVEVALRESEAKLAEAVRLARIGYWNRDLESGRLDWSDMLFEIFDLDPAGFDHSLEGFLSRVHPEDRSRVRGRILAAEAERTGFEHVYRIVAGERVRFIQENGSVVTNPQGDPIRVAGTARDVTELVQAEEAVRLRDRAIQAVTQGIVITDPNQRDNPIIYASPGFERLTGYGPDELVGRNCRFLQGKETDRGVVAQVRAAVQAGEPCDVELLNYRKDGKPFWNALSVSPVRDENGRLTHFIGVQTDVTDRHQLEMQFQQAQKMEAVGRLAGGVAHDFNNLLTIINGYTDLLVDQLPAGSPLREMVGEVHKAGERAGTLTRQLLVFSRQSVLEPKVLDVNAVLADTEKMLRRLIGEDIQLSTILEPHRAPVKVDPGQLQQAIINLAVNSRDAMPRGGRLTVETRSVDLTEKYCQSHPDCKPGRHLMLAMIDTGAGMDDATIARIFEPFFTTKEPGKGTGLGLAMVYGFVKSSGGHITVASEVGRGTTFRLYFPQVREPVSLGGKSSPGLARLEKGHETVLLVEDDDAVRALTRRVLLGSGYVVLEAADGRDAVRVAEGHAGPIQLLVTDVVMPHMGGRQVAERIAAIKPGIKVLYCSGYTDDAVVRYGVESGIPFVQKPYSPAILTQKIREVLDS